jgi:hypothetical protein
MNKKKILFGVGVIVVITMFAGCAGMSAKPTESSFVAPTVSLDLVEVAHYWGWWYFAKKVEPTAGEAGDYGAPLDLAFIYNIENPNPFPVRLDSLKFTVAFEEFDLNTVSSTDVMWIPAGKTNQLRVHAMFDGRQSLLSLLVTGGFKLQEKTGKSGAGAALAQLGAWWKAAPEYGFPIHVKEGSAVFQTDGLTKVATFSATFP